MNRAYAVLKIKAVDEERRVFSGIASSASTDRMGDIVEPKGAVFKLPIPLLWQHDSMDPVGWITSAKVTSAGIEVEGEIAKVDEDGYLKRRLTTAWQMLKSQLVRGLSIGFNPLEYSEIKGSYGYRFTSWEWLELSAVTIPANQDATITAIKSIDESLLAASGRGRGSGGRDVKTPGVSGTANKAASSGFSFSRNPKGKVMKTLKELREDRELKSARMRELTEVMKSVQDDISDDEASEFDALVIECKHLDNQIRMAQFDAMNSASAREVSGKSFDDGTRSRGPTIIVKKTDPDDSFKGQSYIRNVIAKAVAAMELRKGNFVRAEDVANHRWGKTHPNLVQYIKAGVAGGGTGSGEWGAELADSDTRYTGDFIEFLYGMTVFDRLPLRSIPARVHIKGQDGAATGYWVGESKGIPASAADFSDVELNPLKVGALAECSKELQMSSSPSAEMLIRDTLGQASAQRVDTTFLSGTAASAGVSPAGLLNGVAAAAPSGTDAAAVRADLMTLYTGFLAAKNASGLVQIMNPALAKALSLLVNSLGQVEFPGLNASGGVLLGDPVFTGDNVTGGYWILMKPSDIYKIGDGGVQISMSDQATIEQDTAPQGASDTPVAASANMVNMFQTESVAFKVVRQINYAKRRSSAVSWLDNAEYGGVVS
jgi:HK97 family phage prohead protease